MVLASLATPALAQLPDNKSANASDAQLEHKREIDGALKAEDRPLEHRLRDDRREVRRIITAGWPAARPMSGARVLDIASGGGYLALIWSSLVGPEGHVDIHNTPGWIAQFPGMDPEMQRGWIKRANIGWVTLPWHELDAPEGSYDIIFLGQVYHDIVFEGGDYAALNQRLFKMLTLGGRVVVEDHDAIETMPLMQQAGLHRISHGDVIGQFLAAGFVQAAPMDAIESRYDDRKMNVFWPNVRGRTDRFILVFEKPLDGKPARPPEN